jgi:hypothetical protein
VSRPERASGGRQAGSGDGQWRPGRLPDPGCGPGHVAAGSVDESSRRLSHEEFAVATLLASEGHTVRSLPENRGVGRVADLDVCGSEVEVKAWQSLAERAGRPPTSRSVLNKLLKASGQAPRVVLYAKGSGLLASEARRGVELYAGGLDRRGGRSLSGVRVVGDGFDLSWTRRPGLRPAPAREPGRPRHPEVGTERRGSERRPRPDLGL